MNVRSFHETKTGCKNKINVAMYVSGRLCTSSRHKKKGYLRTIHCIMLRSALHYVSDHYWGGEIQTPAQYNGCTAFFRVSDHYWGGEIQTPVQCNDCIVPLHSSMFEIIVEVAKYKLQYNVMTALQFQIITGWRNTNYSTM